MQFSEGVAAERHYFGAALEDPETCQLVLEIIFGQKLPEVKVHAEHNVIISSDFHSVRFDIYATDELKVSYDLEAQNADEGNLPKRGRYYQAELDVASLKPGMKFNDLKPSYIIFICTFDPFGKDSYRYVFTQYCKEKDMELRDETYKIFLNTKGKNEDEVPSELVHFLKYMEKSTNEYVAEIKDDLITKLHDKITRLKKWRKLEERYMTGEEWAQQRERIAKREGRTELIEKFLEELGAVPEELMQKIAKERDLDVLGKWTKIAAKATSIEDFISKM